MLIERPSGCGEFAELVRYECWKEAFVNGRQTLQTCSHKRKSAWIKALVHILTKMDKLGELPKSFNSLTILAQQDVLSRIEIKFR